MKKLSLYSLLDTQDMSSETASNYANSAENATFDYEKDPVSGIIVNAFQGNRGLENEEQVDSAINDLDYAISQLTKARNRLQEHYNSL